MGDNDCGSVMALAILTAIKDSTVTGALKDILVLGLVDPWTSSSMSATVFRLWVTDLTNGVQAKLGRKVTLDSVVGTGINTVQFSKYKMIYVPTVVDFVPGISCADINLMNARKIDFIKYVNNFGGSIVSFTEHW